MNTLYDTYLNHMANYGKIIKINGNSTTGFFKEYDEKKDSNDHKYLFTNINTLKQGDEIEALGQYWLNISHIVNYNGVYEKGLIRESKYSIKFAFPDGEVKQFTSVIDTKALDIKTNQYIALPDGKILVTMQENQDSNNIVLDQRFIIMGSAWKVVGIDKSKIGLIILTCQSDAFNEFDDRENEIADAKKYIHTYTIDITNGESADMDYRETTLQLTVSCTDNAVIVENPVVTYVSNNEYVATIDSSGLITCHGTGQAVITATYRNVSDTFVVNGIEVIADNYSIEYVNPATSIKSGRTVTFTIKVLNNGVEVLDKPVTFNLRNEDESANVYATITGTTSNTVSVQASSTSSYVGKYFYLKCMLTEDNSIFAEQRIKVASLY